MRKEQIEYICVKDLKSYNRNPRKNDNAVRAVANSIKEFGFKNPIIIDKDNIIVAGHTRLKAAKSLGLKEVPCFRADDLTPEQINAYRIADNSTSDLAEWDTSLLDLEIDSLPDFDFSDFGIEKKEKAEVDLKELELKPYSKVHYLITLDLTKNDLILDCLDKLKAIEGVEIESTLN